MNKKIPRLAVAYEEVKPNTTDSSQNDLTKKWITPMGGFGHYGIMKNDSIMIKSSLTGTVL